VSGHLTGNSLTVTGKVVRRSVTAGPAQAELQRQYADLDASIEPEAFRAPDLTTPQARRDAREAGVDIDRWLARH
jgi:hypothetical protein